MFPLAELNFTLSDLKARCERLIGPLNLFDRDTEAEDRIRKLEAYQPNKPVLTIDEEVKHIPESVQRLLQLVKRRLVVKPNFPSITVEEQQSLVTVLLGEVAVSWRHIKDFNDDAFLDSKQNFELNRRIVIHIVSVCEQLFELYRKKAEILNSRGVFTALANISRLKAQLAVDAHQFLDVPTVRRYIAQELRSKSTFSGREYDRETKLHLPLTHQQLIDISRPVGPDEEREIISTWQHLVDMATRMPVLNRTPAIYDAAANVPDYRSVSVAARKSPKSKEKENKPARKTSEQLSREKVLLKRSASLPILPNGETLLEELGIDSDTSSTISLNERQSRTAEDVDLTAKASKVNKTVTVYDDLQQLMGLGDADQPMEDEDDMPPLLRAYLGQNRRGDWKEWQRRQLEEINERNKKRREAESIKVSKPTHAQPDTASTSLPKQPEVRYSDVRISERNSLSCFALVANSPLYNDLMDEIDQSIIKKLDSMLFLGEEVTEVYRELERTMPTDHLVLTNDALVIPAADLPFLTTCMSSTTLRMRKQDRLINAKLMIKDTPHQLPENHSELVNRLQTQWAMQTKDAASVGLDKMAARDQAIWWTTWKTQCSSDDYFTYLTLKDTDYLTVVHHLFEEIDDDEVDDGGLGTSRVGTTAGSLGGGGGGGAGNKSGRSRVKKIRLSKALLEAQERDEKSEALRREKTQYTPGLWNVNTILMGGLGRDPEPEKVEPVKVPTPPPDLHDLRNQSRSKALVVSRKSLNEAKSSATTPLPDIKPTASESNNLRSLGGVTSRLSVAKNQGAVGVGQQQQQQLSVQQRLERVWDQLQVPDKMRLDHAIKYSSDSYFKRLEAAVGAWEDIAEMIMEREALLLELEKFEIFASDPHRYFQKGIQGSSKVRLKEARKRQQFNEKIDALSDEIRTMLEQLKKELHDEITFRGRPYEQKMQWDRTEMLYWLQEDRKRQLLDRVKLVQRFVPTVNLPLTAEETFC